MNELIKINYETDRPTVSGRELHAALEVLTPYRTWFPRMCEYGYTEGTDFTSHSIERVQTEGSREVCREVTDHQLTIEMAEGLCLFQRSEAGKRLRQYLSDIKSAWNSPDAVLAQAYKILQSRLDASLRRNDELALMISVKDQQLEERAPKTNYYDVVLRCEKPVSISVIAKDYGWSVNRLNSYLSEKGVQNNQYGIWLLNEKYFRNGYTRTEVFSGPGNERNQVCMRWTRKGRLFIYSLLKADGIVPIIEKEA